MNQQIDSQKCIVISHRKSTAYKNKSLKLWHWALNARKYVRCARTFYSVSNAGHCISIRFGEKNLLYSFFLYLRKLSYCSHIFEVKTSLHAPCILFPGQWISLIHHAARWNALSCKLGWAARGRKLFKILIFIKTMTIVVWIIHCFISLQIFSRYKW